MQKLLITGGAGLLALNWAIHKRNTHDVVLGLHNKNVSLEKVQSTRIDLSSNLRIEEVLAAISPDVVINTAGLTNVDACESGADHNYNHLKWAAERANNIKIHRSTGVNGRVAAYRTAAELSTTPWFFAVFAKLFVSENFDWTWQPDRLQEPKHYIFHAVNPVNGLVYGHQAMIAYNKQLVLENTAIGLDFTLDQAHEVVPIVSGTAYYNDTPWMAWRTAFREVVKLKHSLPDVENEYRLKDWLNNAGALANGEWSVWGAEDAVEYYDAVGGDFAELKKSYDWAWLASYAMLKRNLLPD